VDTQEIVNKKLLKVITRSQTWLVVLFIVFSLGFIVFLLNFSKSNDCKEFVIKEIDGEENNVTEINGNKFIVRNLEGKIFLVKYLNDSEIVTNEFDGMKFLCKEHCNRNIDITIYVLICVFAFVSLTAFFVLFIMNNSFINRYCEKLYDFWKIKEENNQKRHRIDAMKEALCSLIDSVLGNSKKAKAVESIQRTLDGIHDNLKKINSCEICNSVKVNLDTVKGVFDLLTKNLCCKSKKVEAVEVIQKSLEELCEQLPKIITDDSCDCLKNNMDIVIFVIILLSKSFCCNSEKTEAVDTIQNKLQKIRDKLLTINLRDNCEDKKNKIIGVIDSLIILFTNS